MSFYIKNIDSKRNFEEVVKGDGVTVVRFGAAAQEECRRVDQLLSTIKQKAAQHFEIYAYEKQDIPAEISQRYRLEDKKCGVMFFSHGEPLLLKYGRSMKTHVLESFKDRESLLSIFVLVKQAVSRGAKSVQIFEDGMG